MLYKYYKINEYYVLQVYMKRDMVVSRPDLNLVDCLCNQFSLL